MLFPDLLDPLLLKLASDGTIHQASVWADTGNTELRDLAVAGAGLLLAGSSATKDASWDSVTTDQGGLNSFANSWPAYNGDLTGTVSPLVGTETEPDDWVLDAVGGENDLLLMQLASSGP